LPETNTLAYFAQEEGKRFITFAEAQRTINKHHIQVSLWFGHLPNYFQTFLCGGPYHVRDCRDLGELFVGKAPVQ